MGVTVWSGALRIGMGLGLMLFAMGAGYLHRSLWILPVLALAFTVSYVTGKLRAWRYAAKTGQMRAAWMGLPATYVTQLILVSVTYLIGFGLGALVRQAVTLQAFTIDDITWPLAAGAIGAAVGTFIDQIEGRPDTAFALPANFPTTFGDDEDDTDTPRERDLHLLPEPVTPETFFNGIYYGHAGTYTDEQGGGYDPTPNEKSAGSDAKIAEAEARLGLTLPEGLRAIYRVQNGGNVAEVCIPNDGVADPRHFDDILTPFSGYDTLLPLEGLRTMYDAVCDYEHPDADNAAENFPPGCQNLIVLAQWYRFMLFLDYRAPGPPKVGYTDLDEDVRLERARWWPDFETFFAALRRYETD